MSCSNRVSYNWCLDGIKKFPAIVKSLSTSADKDRILKISFCNPQNFRNIPSSSHVETKAPAVRDLSWLHAIDLLTPPVSCMH